MIHPNVILLVCDQLRAFEVGCYGNDHIRTPHIDALAAGGTRFATAVTNNPVCTPARSILMSGQYSRSCTGMCGNVHDNPPNPRRERLVDTTLPEAFRAAGYRTALIGKWHMDPQPQLIGFETAVYPDFEHAYYHQRYWNEEGASWLVEAFANDYELAQLHGFLEERDDRPFFLYYNIGQPHQPIGPGHMPERYCSLYDPAEVPIRPNVPEALDADNARWWYNIYTSADFYWRDLARQPQAPRDLVDESFGIRDLTALYYGATTMVDDYVGKLRQALAAAGLADNTIICFLSDHGDNLGSHGMFNKGQLIEESIRVPFIVNDPRQPAGIVADDGVASLIDVMPTLLDLAAVPRPESLQGRSLAPVIRGDGSALPDHAFIETGGMIGVRTRDHLYGLGFNEERRSIRDTTRWFHDLQADPYELDNRPDEAPPELDAALRDWDARTPWHEAPPAGSIHDYLARGKWVAS